MSRKERFRRTLLVSVGSLLTILSIAASVAGLKLRSIAEHLPPVNNLADTRSHPMTTIVTSDGVLLARFETRYRRPVRLEQISPKLLDATLATEDSRFYTHTGVDTRGIARAVVSNIGSGNWTGQGGSTITQQLVRNLYLNKHKTLGRKIEEILLAVRIEKRYSKHDILEAYLNTIYYGNGCYGAEAASEAYFHKSALDLTLGEAALLAGLPQRPASLSPTQHLPEALARRSEVLNRMEATGKISAEEARRVAGEPIKVYSPRLRSQNEWKAPYFVAHVLRTLRERFGAESVYSGIHVVTTLNWQMQKAAERSLHTGLRRGLGPNTGAIISLDPRNGAIRALVGGADFKRDQYDAAIQGVRQPGSAFKPIVYATAFDLNVCNLVNTVDDKKLVYRMPPKDWVVHNYDGGYRGKVTILDALRMSINTAAVQVAEQTGLSTIETYAQGFGISTPMAMDLPLALGASGVHPIDLCSAFSAFANRGARYEPYCLQQVTDARNDVLFQDDPNGRYHAPFMSASTIDQINVALREVVLNGTGSAASSIPDAHGKTGTTSSHRDAWFVGYTGSLATAVWMAHVDKRIAKDGHRMVTYRPMPGATGGQACAPVWSRFMRVAVPVQARIDRTRGIETATVEEPAKATLMSQLAADVERTGMEEAKLSEQQYASEQAGTEGSIAAYQPAPEFANSGVSYSRPTVISVSAQNYSGIASSDEAEMHHDMEDGLQEFEQQKERH